MLEDRSASADRKRLEEEMAACREEIAKCEQRMAELRVEALMLEKNAEDADAGEARDADEPGEAGSPSSAAAVANETGGPECGACGAALQTGARFCTKCGADVKRCELRKALIDIVPWDIKTLDPDGHCKLSGELHIFDADKTLPFCETMEELEDEYA